jgi:hypothetical protein
MNWSFMIENTEQAKAAVTSDEVEKFEKDGWPNPMNWDQASAALMMDHAVESLEFPYPMVFMIMSEQTIEPYIEYQGKVTLFRAQPLLITRSVNARTWKLADERLKVLLNEKQPTQESGPEEGPTAE